MQRVDGTFLLSPSDLNHFVACEHLTTLERRATEDEGGAAPAPDAQAEIVRAMGFAHEQRWLAQLRAAGRQVVEVGGAGPIDWERDAGRTVQAMRAGAEVVYQAIFQDAPWRGVADFLLRVETPSALGGWSYEACDTKLARHPKPSFVLQLCWYSEQLARLQGLWPRRFHVVLGSGAEVAYSPHDFLAYYRAVRARYGAMLASSPPTYPSPVAHCHVCDHAARCEQQRRRDDHLSLVAGIRRDHVERLQAAGVATVAALAVPGAGATAGLAGTTLARLVRQAQLQVGARTSPHRYELLTPEPGRGFGLLPAPSHGDLFFDIEGYPYFEPAAGLEYLWGVVGHDDGAWRFRSFECVDREGERRAFEAFIDFVHARLRVDPDLHVYHYAPYEPSAVKRLMGTCGTREAEVDDLLRRGVFVDLYQVVRQSMQISYDSYSLKRVREFFMTGAGKGAVTAGGESILEFQRFLETGDIAILDAIRAYNTEDCESTRLLRDWLLERKTEAERQFGQPIAWHAPAPDAGKAPDDDGVSRELRERLAAFAAETVTADPERARAAALLAHLVDYHRREAKPGWWASFDRLKKSLDELRDDPEAIAGLSPAPGVEPARDKRSFVHTLQFPDQEYKLKEGSAVRDAVDGRSAGQIVSIDPRGQLVIKRGPSLAEVPLPAAIVAEGPVATAAQRESLARIAQAWLDGRDVHHVARAMLAGAPPRIDGVAPGVPLQTMEPAGQEALVAGLDRSWLVVQGPPGSGKTHTAARLIAALVGNGRRVAVAATSHKAIHNLLDAVADAGQAAGVGVTGLKKGSGDEESVYERHGFRTALGNDECAATDLPVVAGTAWLFSRPDMEGRFDYLFVDEAGQVSLADAVAMSPCARSVVLLGDPQQLPHVTQGTHPGGAGASVLEHLLQGESTVPADRGLFLEETWRMHPDVCRFISALAYDGRLRAEAGTARQRVTSCGLTGSGLRYLAVAHQGNAQQSQEEAEAIAAQVRQLLSGGTFTDRDGHERPLTPADILVVAPYNMQVRTLLRVLPAGVEAGTVDRFQGRQAPVVFFSMTTSRGDEIPRGLEFLFSRNRLNVAMSRARALAVLVCAPRLLETHCRTVEQMRLVNGLCAFVEQAAVSAPAASRQVP